MEHYALYVIYHIDDFVESKNLGLSITCKSWAPYTNARFANWGKIKMEKMMGSINTCYYCRTVPQTQSLCYGMCDVTRI